MKGRRFLAYSAGALAGAAAAGRLVRRRDRLRPDPAGDDHIGSIRGLPRVIRGARASELYTEWFPSPEGGVGTAILTHGYCLTEAAWHYQKRDLSGGSLSLVTWDLPGHGHSPALPPGRLNLDLAADSLARVIDEYAAEGTILVGHSLGGVVTARYLSRHPETATRLIAGMVLVSTPMSHFASPFGRWPGARIESALADRSVRTVIGSGLFDRVLGRDVGTEDLSLSYRLVRWGFGRLPSPAQVRFVRDVIASVPRPVRRDAYRVMTGHDLGPELETVRVPALVMIGRRDRLVNPAESREMAARIPDSRTVVFPDAGHAPLLEVHEAFNSELRRFAGRVLGPGSTGGAGTG